MSVVYYCMDGEILAENRGGTVTHLIPDTLGNVIETRDSAGTKTSDTAYWPYGEVRTQTGANPTPWGFVGTMGYYSDTGSPQMYVRARFYYGSLGRWTAIDLLWPNESPYTYSDSDAVSFTDPSGMQRSDPDCYPNNPNLCSEKAPPRVQRPAPGADDANFEIGKWGGRIEPPGPGGGKGKCAVYKCFNRIIGHVSHEFLCVTGPNGGCSGGFFRGSGTSPFGAPGGVADRHRNCADWMRRGTGGCVLVARGCTNAQRVCGCIRKQIQITRTGEIPPYSLVGYTCLNWVGTVLDCADLRHKNLPPTNGSRTGGGHSIREL